MIDYQHTLNLSLMLSRQRRANYAAKADKSKTQQEKEYWMHCMHMEEKEAKSVLDFMTERNVYDENASFDMPPISPETAAMSIDELFAELNA